MQNNPMNALPAPVLSQQSTSSSLIKLRGSMHQDSIVAQLKSVLKEKLGEINISKYKNDLILLELLLEIVVNVGPELGLTSQSKQDEIAFEVVSSLFTYTPQEQQTIKSNIEYLLQTKAIKKIKFSKKMFSSISSFFLKKLF